MGKGILGTKLGMTQVFDESGRAVSVTVLEAGPCRVTQIRTVPRDGYEAVQVGFGRRRRVNQPEAGHLKAASAGPVKVLREVPMPDGVEVQVGQDLTVALFSPGERVDVTATSKGKGFQGGVKRHGFGRGPMTHGSKYHRGPGSLSSRTSGGGGRVHPGRKLPGRMGHRRVTVQSLVVERVDEPRNLLLVRGAVPGPRGGIVLIRSAVKAGGGRS